MQKTAMFILGSSLVLWLMTVGCFIPDSIRPGGLGVGDAFISGTGLSLPLVVLGVINYWIIKKRRIETLKELFTSGLFLAWLPNAAILALINIFVLIAFVWSGKPLQEGALIYVAVVVVWPLSAILGTIGAAITKKSKETSSQGGRTIRWSLKFLLVWCAVYFAGKMLFEIMSVPLIGLVGGGLMFHVLPWVPAILGIIWVPIIYRFLK
jgi:hypothetical protein